MRRSFRYNSGRVECEAFGRIVEATYSGLMTAQAFDSLRFDALAACKDADAFVVRLDRTLVAMSDVPALPQTYSANSAAGVWIVRPDQYDFWVRHAQEVAQHGVMRSVWLESHSQMAYQWALRQAHARRAKLLQ